MVLRNDGDEDVIIMIKVKYDIFHLVTQVYSKKKISKYELIDKLSPNVINGYTVVYMHLMGMTMRSTVFNGVAAIAVAFVIKTCIACHFVFLFMFFLCHKIRLFQKTF